MRAYGNMPVVFLQQQQAARFRFAPVVRPYWQSEDERRCPREIRAGVFPIFSDPNNTERKCEHHVGSRESETWLHNQRNWQPPKHYKRRLRALRAMCRKRVL